MQFEYMREFISVVNHSSFTAAANQLLVTQPALSRHIASLESQIGCKLLKRSTHDVTLTPEGQVAYREFSRMVGIYENMLREINALSMSGKRYLRLGVPYYCMDYVGKLCEQISIDYPEVSLEILSFQPSFAYRALRADELDAAMLFNHRYPDMRDLIFHDFTEERLLFVTSKEHPIAQAGHAYLRQVSEYSLVLPRSNYFSDFVYGLLCDADAYPQDIVYTDSIDTVPFDVKKRADRRLAINPECVRSMKSDGLAFILLDDDITVPVSIAYNRCNANPALGMLIKAVDRAFA